MKQDPDTDVLQDLNKFALLPPMAYFPACKMEQQDRDVE